ncbi:MAG: L-threonylcarbamoyladenylate synthase, partial [Microthrixaceae bacterium]
MSNVDHPEPRSETVRVDPLAPDQRVMGRAGAILRSGGLVAFPTETVYGLGANALDSSAIEAVFVAKGRPATDPLIVHISSTEQAGALTTQWTPGAAALADEFWPGPLTLVVPKSPIIGDSITAGRPTVALRVPNHPIAHSLIEAAGVPVAAPSANRFGRISPTTAAHVAEELAGSYELLLDGGPTTIGVESSVVDLSGGRPVLLRPGGVTLEALRRVVPEIEYMERKSSAEEVAADAPGQFLRHYAPRTPLVLVDGGDALVAELRASLRDESVQVSVLELSEDPEVAARQL